MYFQSSISSHWSFNRQKFAQKRIEYFFVETEEERERARPQGENNSECGIGEENRFSFIWSQQFQSVLWHRYAIVLIVFFSNDLISLYLLCIYSSVCLFLCLSLFLSHLLSAFIVFHSRSLSSYDAFTPVYFHFCFFIKYLIVPVLIYTKIIRIAK